MKVLIVFGTRPEAIKMAPVVRRLRDDPRVEAVVCVTGQHRSMLDQVLSIFGIRPDIDLNIMKPGQSLTDITVAVLRGLEKVIADERPDAILVHGDTDGDGRGDGRLCGQVPRSCRGGTADPRSFAPWPEEMNRCYIDIVGRWLFAPTEVSRAALLAEQISDDRIGSPATP